MGTSLKTSRRPSGILLAALALLGSSPGAATALPPPLPEVPRCSVSAGPGDIDFGSRSRGQLHTTTGGMTPGSRTLHVSAGCTLPGVMKLRLQGMAQGRHFSWGSPDSILRIRALNAQTDGEAVQLQKLNAAGNAEGLPSASLSLLPGEGLVAVRQGQPVDARQLSVTLEITPVLGEQDSRPTKKSFPETTLNISLLR